MRCPQCQARHMVEIAMSIGGQQVTLRSCSFCDLRWWEGYQGKMALSGLLDLAAERA